MEVSPCRPEGGCGGTAIWYWLIAPRRFPLVMGRRQVRFQDPPSKETAGGSPAFAVAHPFYGELLGPIQVLCVCALLEFTAPNDEDIVVSILTLLFSEP